MIPDGATQDELSLTLVRIFDAPPSLVFRVWSTAEHVVRWWGPNNFSVPSMKIDFRVNGAWRGCIRAPDGREYWASGAYREIVPPERLVFTYRGEVEGGIDTLVTVTFEEVDGRTRLTFHQAPFPTVADRDSHITGWGECLGRLQADVERQNGAEA